MKGKHVALICISIIVGFVILGLAIYFKPTPVSQDRYQIVSHGDNIFIFDKQTGDYWQKYSSSREGSTEWQKQQNPVK